MVIIIDSRHITRHEAANLQDSPSTIHSFIQGFIFGTNRSAVVSTIQRTRVRSFTD